MPRLASNLMTLVRAPHPGRWRPSGAVVAGVILAILLASSWALLKPGMFRVHDFTHAARIAEMGRGLTEGQLPVRWSQNFGFGYGMPLFEFYAPLPFLVGALPFLAGASPVLIIKLLYVLTSVGTAWGGYLLGKEVFGKPGGVLTAAALTLAPYRAVNIFVRGALSEAAGIMFLPWIVWAIIRLVDGKQARPRRTAALSLTLSLTGLLLTHNLTALMFVPISLAFAGLYIFGRCIYKDSGEKMTRLDVGGAVRWGGRKLLSVLGWYGLAIGLSAFYVFPALLEKSYTKIDSILGGYFDYSLHFLYLRQFVQPNWGYGGSVWGPNDDISFFLGFGQLLLLLIVLVTMAVQLWRRWKRAGTLTKMSGFKLSRPMLIIIISLVLLAAGLFLSLLKAKAIWDFLPLINFIQFPWRWLAVAIVWLAMVAGGSTLFISQAKRWWWAVGWTAALIASNAWFFQPESYLNNPADFYYQEAGLIRREMSGILPDFIPATLSDELEPVSQRYQCGQGECADQDVEALVDRSHQLLLQTRFDKPQVITFNIADFPGWRLELDGRPIKKTVTADGLISATVPAGEHRLGAVFGSTSVRTTSDAVTIASLMVAGYAFVDFKSGSGADHHPGRRSSPDSRRRRQQSSAK